VSIRAGIVAILFAEAAFAARPHDPFILRASMRNKPRMILIALDTGLTVAYDGASCGLYEAWRGLIQDASVSYNHQKGGNHGATYYPQGKIIFNQSPVAAGGEIPEVAPLDTRAKTISPPNEALVAAWSMTQGGQSVPVKADYRGYAVDNAKETATLRYELVTVAGKVRVSEVPESAGTPGTPGLLRDFTFAGIAPGAKVSLLLTGDPIRKADGTLVVEEWTASGTGRIEKLNGKAYLAAEADGKTRVTGTWR
jgi:hypothetical protein